MWGFDHAGRPSQKGVSPVLSQKGDDTDGTLQKGVSHSLSQKEDAADGTLLLFGHRGATSSILKGVNRAPNVDNTFTADANIAAAVIADSGVAGSNIVAAISSDILGTIPPCSVWDRSKIGERPISSFRDHGVVDFLPLRSGSGSAKGVFVVVVPFTWEHGFCSGGSNLPDLRAVIGASACLPKWSDEDSHVDSTHSASKGGGRRVSSSLGCGVVELDFPPLRSDLGSTAIGSVLSSDRHARSADL